jgi:glycosyltransferase involved in cell wall biosynthesis
MPLVSVIIPSYNAGQYIKEAIDSALDQTYKGIEILVIDDSSTDNTKEILAPYIGAGKIIYISQKNAGPSMARNNGIAHSRGKYIAFLDSDDIFLPKKIEHQVAYLETHPECDASYCDLYHFWDMEPDKLFKLDYRYYSGADVLPNLIKRCFIAPLALMIRKDAIDRFGAFNTSFRRSEDLEFFVRLASHGANFVFLDEVLAKLRLRREGNQQSFKSQPEMKRTILAVFQRLSDESSPAGRDRLELAKYLRVHRMKLIFAYLENGQKKEAYPVIRDVLKDYFGGTVIAPLFIAAIAIAPSGLMERALQKYHLRTQASYLKKI